MSNDGYRWTSLEGADANRHVPGAGHSSCRQPDTCRCAYHRHYEKAARRVDRDEDPEVETR